MFADGTASGATSYDVTKNGATKDGPWKDGMPRVQVTLSAGSIWRASDGSIVAGETDRTASAPERFDTEWALFKATRNSGGGLLADVTYIQQVYTHASRPPANPPQRAGETAKVAYLAEYWLYR